ncbi:hypothetical protein C8F01DRAFT_179879 [Mycena amicta]|nr:hypothetical protein C8F01DRAFT_179879 [Mycena amicta]
MSPPRSHPLFLTSYLHIPVDHPYGDLTVASPEANLPDEAYHSQAKFALRSYNRRHQRAMADNIELPVASSPFHDEGLPPPELLVARCLGLVTLAEYGSDDVQVSDVDSLFDEPDHIDFLTVALETASSPPAAGLSSPLAHKGTHCTPRPLGNSPLANVPTARKPGKPQPKLLSYGRSKAVQKVIMQAKIDRLEAHLKVTKEVLAQTVRTSAVAVSNAELELAFLRDATADNLAELKRFKLKFPQGCVE